MEFLESIKFSFDRNSNRSATDEFLMPSLPMDSFELHQQVVMIHEKFSLGDFITKFSENYGISELVSSSPIIRSVFAVVISLSLSLVKNIHIFESHDKDLIGLIKETGVRYYLDANILMRINDNHPNLESALEKLEDLEIIRKNSRGDFIVLKRILINLKVLD